jgi:hypothetical protein
LHPEPFPHPPWILSKKELTLPQIPSIFSFLEKCRLCWTDYADLNNPGKSKKVKKEYRFGKP